MMENDPRDLLKNLIRKHLTGPVNDAFASKDEEELVTDYPVSKYYSGIIFPHIVPNTKVNTSLSDLQSSFLDEEDLITDIGQNPVDVPETPISSRIDGDDADNDDFSRSELFPYLFGLSFCLKTEAPSFQILLSYGRYRQIDPTQELHQSYRISLSNEDYELIKNLNSGDEQFLHKVLGYDSDSQQVYLKKTLQGVSTGQVTGDFANLRKIKQVVYTRLTESKGTENERYSKLNTILRKIMPLYRKTWIRKQHDDSFEIAMDQLLDTKEICISWKDDAKSSFGYSVHVLLIQSTNNHSVVKVMVENTSVHEYGENLILDKPALNLKCMFQAGFRIESDFLIPLPQQPLPTYAGIEDKIIDCQYRNSKVYSLAHNCSCAWSLEPGSTSSVYTDFLPSVIPPVTVNSRYTGLSKALNVLENSCYSVSSDEEVISELRLFTGSYEDWVNQQEELGSRVLDRYAEASAEIVNGQREALERMNQGLEILNSRPEMMKLYRIANGAMLVNMSGAGKIPPETYSEQNNIYYHPFQLAFLLINLDCVINPSSELRSKSIDLLWFPTGGGKTEAYFLLTAFSLLFRRFNNGKQGLGTSVIMRYTLRLLTAQQFERASRMILSLNFVCDQFMHSLTENHPYSIGLWIGAASSPNKLHEGDDSALAIIEKIDGAQNLEDALRQNKFPLSDCPWCGTSLIQEGRMGFSCLRNKFEIRCLNPDCHYHDGLPIDLVDESLYNNPPSLLFATIDKFARLAWVEESSSFFGGTSGNLPPDLIIQDELHLISGPLGSITALFESVIDMLCRKKGMMPRIIASTATIKNASEQVKGLFGNRSVKTFPPPGINYEDNFFAKVDTNDLHRQYIGVLPTGKTFTTTQIKLLSLLLFSRWELKGKISERLDDYWTVVSYYNSLRELGRMYSKARDEIQQAYSQMVLKHYPLCKKHWLNPPKELTSRISGHEVKSILHILESAGVTEDELQNGGFNPIDIVFATNMISVGLDIERLNLILMNGQPKSISEYIQVTSRIARRHPGLVLSLFNPFRVRDKSHFENFASFHHNYYRFVEPISITPYTRIAIRKLMPTLLAAYLRLVKGIETPALVKPSDIDELLAFMAQRMNDDEMLGFMKRKIKEHTQLLRKKLSLEPDLTFSKLLVSASDAAALDYESGDWLAVNSMREVSPNAVIKLHTIKGVKRNADYE
jgi:hypothetical protein